MLDIRIIRDQPDSVKDGLSKVGADPSMVDQVLALDEERRRLETECGELRNKRNIGSKQIGAMKDAAEREALKDEMRAIGDQIAALDVRLNEVNSAQQELMLNIPNLPHPDVPVGKTE